MKNIVLRIALVGALVALPLTASAVMTDAEAAAAVQGMLADGRSSTEIIKTLMDDGRNLEDATVLSVEAATGDAKLDLARVGICLAEDVAEAEEVGRACVDVCTPDTGEIIENLIDGYSLESKSKEWRFNIRPSNTQPLLRLNVEAKKPELVDKIKNEIVEMIKA